MLLPLTEVLNKLRTITPALSDKELIPILTHFWFQGETVMAFNDQIAIQVPLETKFKGAIPGKLLLNLLSASGAESIKFKVSNGSVEIKAANAVLTVTLLPPEDFVFAMPATEGKGIEGSGLWPAIKSCMGSISDDTSIPDQLGLTLIPNGKDLLMYSTNNMTLSHARVGIDTTGLPKRAILSRQFCQQLVHLTRFEEAFQLFVRSDHVLATIGTTKLFGRLIDSSHPLDFDSIMQAHLPQGRIGKLVPMPKNLRQVLQRAMAVGRTEEKNKAKSLISIKDGKIMVLSESPTAHLDDKVVGTVNHPDVDVNLNPALLKIGADQYDKLLFTKSCAVMTSDNDKNVYLVSAINEKEAS
jgi:DNA polymerase III sliding clamp (beta) subunit (PCNA family)